MDRKDYIINGDGCHASAGQFVPFANEAFLVTLANKGLYKRALKDLETTGQIALTVTGSNLQVQLDDITVCLASNVSQSTCSCPSKTVCKHILMGILAAAGYAATAEDDKDAVPETSSELPSSVPWEKLINADLTQLRKQAG